MYVEYMHVFKRDWSACLIYEQHSKVTLIGGDQYDHLESMRIFALIMHKILILAQQSMREGLRP